MQNSVVRYSDEDLEAFRELIQNKMEKAKSQLDDLKNQLLELMDSNEEGFGTDYIDDSSTGTQLEMLNDMAIRQRKFIQDLENALVRINNKSYGICTVTGELIDKKRLMAVPTTTKSLAAKVQQPQTPVRPASSESESDEDEDEVRPVRKPVPTPKVITKVIRKTPPKTVKPKEDDEGLDEPPVWDDDFDDDTDPISYMDDMDAFSEGDVEGDGDDENL